MSEQTSVGELAVKAGRTSLLLPNRSHYCGGCGHGVIHRLIAEIIEEMGMRDRTVAMAPVGCAVLLYQYIDVDSCEAPHGRTPAVATGIKRARPDLLVFSYQGDGDLAAIGTNEIIHTANRGENLSVIFVNNAVYGMTGGQMAPTTLLKQKTTTTPAGRDMLNEGPPIRVCELLSGFERVVYLERCMITTVKEIRRTKRAIQKSFRIQMAEKGFSMVEVLSPCPVAWRVPPEKCTEWIERHMTKVFPAGVIKDTSGVE
ncbi:MAG: thiamine pyrophosphate-dependent enzyme [Planctomycetia bacterium]|nr:thiamine pyrophosphate-dependent enzyme [Planctomycetia bacterium]